MKLAVYRDSGGKIIRVHIVNMDDKEIPAAVEQHNTMADKRATVSVIEAEDNGLIAYLWTAYRTSLDNLRNELREAGDAAEDLASRLSGLCNGLL